MTVFVPITLPGSLISTRGSRAARANNASEEIPNPDDVTITLHNNGELKQTADTKDLIYDIGRLIEFASSFYTLYPGDVYYTGTPQGVAAVKPGDVLRGSCDAIGAFEIAVRAHEA